MVRSENFSDVIAMIVATDKQGVVAFLRSQGVNVSQSADVTDVVKTLYVALTSSTLRANFIDWADSRYKSEANMTTESYANGGFDPMATQGSGQEFDALSSQMGANLLEDGFANMSGEFDAMNSQSGGFSSMESQYANLGGGKDKSYTPYDSTKPVGTTGSGFGNFLRGIDFSSLINSGVSIWQQKEQSDAQQDTINAGIKAKEIELQTLLEQGKINQQQFQAQLELARLNKNAPQSSVILWVVGGVVLLGALGTAIYFATRKK